MSSRRSRSGGSLTLTTFSRWYRSWRNVPAAIASARSRLVAEIRRTLTLIGSLVPTRTISPISSDAEQLDLRRERDVADLVEEQRAAVGVLEPALPLAVGAGEGPLDVAEQLALQDVLAEGRAVQRDERLVPPRAVVVQGLGHELLARAALARDQDRGRGRRDLAEPGDDRVHLRRVADDPLEAELLVELPLELDVRSRQPLRLRRLVDDGAQLADVERLGQVRAWRRPASP